MTANQDKNLLPRPPIVVVMGHVDHGKTTLLDYLRKTNIATKEAGGITQSIGAYEIIHPQRNADSISINQRPPAGASSAGEWRAGNNQYKSAPAEGRKITFIDTPGHEAFSKMRARGATVADLAILVVAADEGVKPQTVESIKILNETKTPFVVAITKIDKSGANIEKVKNELLASGVLLEGYGGRVSVEPISAKTGEHINDLLDLVLLATDVENLTYDPGAPASGYVLETKIDSRRGLEATVIIKNGILKQGDFIATPTACGRIKILENFRGETVKQLEPSAPGLIIGFEKLPMVGEEFLCGESQINTNIPRISQISGIRGSQLGENSRKTGSEDSEKMLKIILKAGDAGSLEALSQIINAIAAEKPLKIVSEAVGDVHDNDVNLAISAQAIIIAFKNRINKTAKTLAEANRITIIASEIIYELLKTIEEFLKQAEKTASPGEIEILAIFNQAKPEKQVVGGKVVSGAFRNKTMFKIIRGAEQIGNGRVLNIQENKKDVPQINVGSEAGLLVNSETLIRVGDRLMSETG
jgi:translation initiation factor IF-2